MSCNSLEAFPGSLTYTITSSLNTHSFTSSFAICIHLIFLSCLIAIAKHFSTVLNIYRKDGQPYSVLDISGITLSFSPFNFMLAIGLLYIAFIMFRYVSCIPDLLKSFIMNEYALCQGFIASNKMIICLFFFFQSVYMVNHAGRFSYVKSTLNLLVGA